MQTAVPGWDNVRLLAPHAELKMQACGQSPLIDAHRLRYAQSSPNARSMVWAAARISNGKKGQEGRQVAASWHVAGVASEMWSAVPVSR